MRLQLGDEDRKRLECPEWLDFDPAKLMIDDAIALEAEAGIGPDAYLVLARGTPLFEGGEPVLDDKGKLRFAQAAVFFKVVAWLALRHADIRVPWAELTFDFRALQFRGDNDDDEPGDDDVEDKTPDPD